MNLISKMFLLIMMLMIPVILLYMYSNQQTIKVVEDQINLSNQNRLVYFLNEIDGAMNQVSNYTNIITKDPDFAELAGNVIPADRYAYSALVANIESKLALFSLSSDWMSRISLYFPASKSAISSHSPIKYDESYLTTHVNTTWTLRSTMINGITQRVLTRYFVEPYAGVSDLRKASIIVEVDLMEETIISLLDSFKTKGNNDPFLYKAPGQYVLNSTSEEGMAHRIIASYDLSGNSPIKNHDIIMLGNKKYLLYFYTSPQINWTLVDYVPLEDILAPVTGSQNLFYVTVGLLLAVGVAAVFLLYVQVQVSIKLLTESVYRIKKGQFSTRIKRNKNQEFYRLINQFNEMAAQIQHLVEKVYLEEIRSKEAVMKQLQSQINPHFLYNSLAYIISMAKMNRSQHVVSMAYSLADYYKYTTRNGSMETTISEEIAFVTSYIHIMNYQLDKIRYDISIPPSMYNATIPRLLIQPIVENAIVHGLESQPEGGQIVIIGTDEPDWYTITVEDDGVGIQEWELNKLNARLSKPGTEGESFGIWNVHQRLRYQFGPESGLTLEASSSGGMKVVLRWQKAELEKGVNSYVLDTDR
ncbi:MULTISPECIES: sensor histidine kinase [unclassified Paenibacillus]|uniref:sensor histidine kinase n=1 Tax=unclassified Paenibacillus TaxID=185978 RepID=UPI00362F2AF8